MTRNATLVAIGCALLGYALLGNYLALPGYLRFLERGATSAAGNGFDLDVVIGATKTIIWMFSFQLGTLCLACAYAMRWRLAVKPLVIACIAWLVVWAWPEWPLPGVWFYVLFGSLLLALIGSIVLLDKGKPAARRAQVLELGAIVFFAFATWEVCGLGTTGRMLDPGPAQPMAHTILVSQSSKLMLEFVIAWTLLFASIRFGGRDVGA